MTKARVRTSRLPATHDRVQVGPGRGEPPALVHVAVEGREALLAVAVHVLRQRVAGLLDGLEERAEQWVRRRAPLEDERTRPASPHVVRPGREAVLHPLEVRQAVGVVPGLHAAVGGPPLEVHRVAPLEDHAVDAAAAAEHLAARVVDPPVVHVRLGLGLVLPVVEPAADRERQRRRHVDEDVPRVVAAARLENEHPGRAVGGQPVRQRAPGRPSADDDDVVPLTCHVDDPFAAPERPARARPRRRADDSPRSLRS